ncbi:hypothetical protein Bca4012_006523 [Brassica carinata]
MIVQKMPSFTHINGFAVVLDDSIMAETERTMIMSQRSKGNGGVVDYRRVMQQSGIDGDWRPWRKSHGG